MRKVRKRNWESRHEEDEFLLRLLVTKCVHTQCTVYVRTYVQTYVCT